MPDKKRYDDMKHTIYTEGLENVPKRFSISWRNKRMIQQSDVVVTYVTQNFGGAWQYKTLEEKQEKS